jgi:hypothetical protein
MSVLELVIAAACVAGGARSLWYWLKRPIEGTDVTDHLLFAAFVTGRVGTWWSLATLFLLYGLSDARGQAFVDDVRRFNWFFLVIVALAALQVVTTFILGRRSSGN